MNGFETIGLSDQDILTSILQRNESMASEWTFAYFYMWQCDYQFQYAVRDGWLLIVSEASYDIPFALCPIPVNGVFEEDGFCRSVKWLRQRFCESGSQLVFGRIEASRLPWFSCIGWTEFTIERSDRTADYLYEGDSLRELSGRKYGSKRNHISQFIRHYPHYEVIPVGPDNLDECRRIIDEWCVERDCTCDSPENCERYACNRMLDAWDSLEMSGILIRIGTRFEAFTIGERLTEDTVAIRFEKGNAAVHGVYSVLNRDYLKQFWPEATYVNREEDMGIEGLRKAKKSYHPCRMVEKYSLFLQG